MKNYKVRYLHGKKRKNVVKICKSLKDAVKSVPLGKKGYINWNCKQHWLINEDGKCYDYSNYPKTLETPEIIL